MDSNFFDDIGDTVVQPQLVNDGGYEFNQDQHEDEFDFSANENNVQAVTVSTHNDYDPENEMICKIREEEEKVQERLREKSNKEYEEKQKRKEEGRKQYEEFMARKQLETNERRQTNKQKVSENNNTNVPEFSPWKKVGENVGLKQGEYKGSKDITRMRESIINKRDDELRNK